MKKKNNAIVVCVGFFILGGLCSAGGVVPATEMTAIDIMTKNFLVSKFKTLKIESTMVLINSKGQTRERKNTSVSALQENGMDTKLLVRFYSPPDIKGSGFLQIERSEGENDIWLYLPALKKSRRLVANNKKDSFMGSDFSNGDILPPKVGLYHHTLLRSEVWDGCDCYVIESVPIEEMEKRNSGYSKKTTWVCKSNFIEMKVEYFDTDGRPLKTQITEHHKLVDRQNQRWLALQREMKNHQTGHKTIFTFDRIETGMPIADNYFSTRTIERE